MEMSAASKLLARQAARKGSDEAQVANIPVMLAVLSVQQAGSVTARRVREENRPESTGDQPARMAAIFAPPSAMRSLPQGTAGAFNTAVAARLSTGGDGENDVYSGV